MNKKLGLILAVPLLAGAGYAGWQWWSVGRFVESTDNAYVEAEIITLSTRVAGHIDQVAVVENQRVKEGDIILRLDDRDFRARVDQARAQRDAASAAISNIDSRLALEDALIAQASAELASADAEKQRAGADANRYTALATRDFASKQQLSTSQADAAKASASVKRARAALEAERGQIAVLRTQRVQAEANLAEANAALVLAESDLEKTVLRAPKAGVIGRNNARPGQYVNAGTQLMALVPVSDAYVTANFKETQIDHLRIGQPVTITVDAYHDLKVTGRIASLSPASGAQFSLLPPENATGNFTKIVQRVPVRIALPKTGPMAGKLRPGLSVEVAVDTRAGGKDLIGIEGPEGTSDGQVAER
jgi:membrane fusion protein (multidrug efflux system)